MKKTITPRMILDAKFPNGSFLKKKTNLTPKKQKRK